MPTSPLPRTKPLSFSVVLTTGFIVLLAVLIALFALMRHQAYEERLAGTRAAATSTLQSYEQALANIPTLSASEKQSMRRFLNPIHLENARAHGIDPPSSREEAADLVAGEALSEIEPNPHYDVAPMNYSVAAVTPSTSDLLDLIGARFQERLEEAGLPPYRFQITSATRTTEDQNRLRRVNGNAAQNSAHQFGTTVDVHYARFRPPTRDVPLPDTLDVLTDPYRELVDQGVAELGQSYHSRLKAILGRVMLELQEEGKLVVVYERRQPVYHLTVAQEDIPAPRQAQGEELARATSP